jgi:hypothetical protein
VVSQVIVVRDEGTDLGFEAAEHSDAALTLMT